MAVVALLVFSTIGFGSALVGFFGLGLTFGAAVTVYLGLSIMGPLFVVPVAHALSAILGQKGSPAASA
ncbi:hypothetical protein [Thalassovita sp.]|jgi:hypothetical protein|uniref:hypothetical protein n=1 Tax=Thalassovita sp. TaxID=1979401 RepID=UPI003B5934A5